MEKHTITSTTRILMIAAAVFFDVLSLIPVLGEFTDVFGQLTFWLWFKMNGVSYNSTKRVTTIVTGTIVGLIPVLNMLPEMTIEVIIILGTLKAEEVAAKVPGGNKVVSITSKGKVNIPVTEK